MKNFFKGSLENLRKASAVVKVPCLRKDFIVDEFQVLEARANSADAVLLIVAALIADELTRLALGARAHGLDVLCEVHDKDELQRAVDAGCDLIGVNTRDLRTFEVDGETAFRVAERIPENVVKWRRAGFGRERILRRLRTAGYEAFLIGESLMRANSAGRSFAGVGCGFGVAGAERPVRQFARAEVSRKRTPLGAPESVEAKGILRLRLRFAFAKRSLRSG